MIRKLTTIPAIAFFLVMSCTASAQSNIHKRVAVFDFDEKGDNVQKDIGEIATNHLITELIKTGRVNVLERQELKRILDEQQFNMSGLVLDGSAVEVGKMCGVNIIISGVVYSADKKWGITLKMISTEDASIMMAESLEAKDAESTAELIARLTEIIVQKFPYEGYIISRNDSTVMIDIGSSQLRDSGVIFKVFSEGLEILHPVTNEVLDREIIDKGWIKVSSVREKTSDAVILEESEGSYIERGDRIISVLPENYVIEGGTTKLRLDFKTEVKSGTFIVSVDGKILDEIIFSIKPGEKEFRVYNKYIITYGDKLIKLNVTGDQGTEEITLKSKFTPEDDTKKILKVEQLKKGKLSYHWSGD